MDDLLEAIRQQGYDVMLVGASASLAIENAPWSARAMNGSTEPSPWCDGDTPGDAVARLAAWAGVGDTDGA